MTCLADSNWCKRPTGKVECRCEFCTMIRKGWTLIAPDGTVFRLAESNWCERLRGQVGREVRPGEELAVELARHLLDLPLIRPALVQAGCSLRSLAPCDDAFPERVKIPSFVVAHARHGSGLALKGPS